MRNTLPYALDVVTTSTEMMESRRELIVPSDPTNETSYLLLFHPKNTIRLEHSLLVRLTDTARDFSELKDHPQITEIITELRNAYDGQRLQRYEIKLPTHKQVSGLLYSGDPSDFAFNPEEEQEFHVIKPYSHMNVAQVFDEIFQRYNAIKALEKKSYSRLEAIAFANTSIAEI